MIKQNWAVEGKKEVPECFIWWQCQREITGKCCVWD